MKKISYSNNQLCLDIRKRKKCYLFYKENRKMIMKMMLLLLIIMMVICCYYLIVWNNNLPSKNYKERPNVYFNEGNGYCFDNRSIWYQLRYQKKEIIDIKDAIEKGGASPKSILTFKETLIDNEDYYRSHIDPMNNKIVTDGLFLSKTSSSLFNQAIFKPQITNYKDHLSSSFNEVIAFHFDCLINLRKTPPSTGYFIDLNMLYKSLSVKSKKKYKERGVKWDNFKTTSQMPGMLQLYYPNVVDQNIFVQWINKHLRMFFKWFHLSKQVNYVLYNYLLSDVTIREYSQRDILDYILGNYDRNHNEFFVVDDKAEEEDSKYKNEKHLILLDHNNLKRDIFGDKPFELSICKYYFEDVYRLISYSNHYIPYFVLLPEYFDKVTELNLESQYQLYYNLNYDNSKNLKASLLDSLRSYELDSLFSLGTHGDLFNVFKFLNKRLDEFLIHIDRCVVDYGFHYVFD
eukprot:TRINITY_DN2781_c0_g1_i1.p1 TRINITY_DN2781_c0_g1~~TRINITY_DN2781_c0_g1_i1.p1  ORF type:complete len:460 (-),score=55.86 TRINITY_DN2781_c0_g1_i1:192-1571(-)